MNTDSKFLPTIIIHPLAGVNARPLPAGGSVKNDLTNISGIAKIKIYLDTSEFYELKQGVSNSIRFMGFFGFQRKGDYYG